MQVWFRDKKFRQAVAHAVDKQRIIDEVYKGIAEPLFAAEPASNKLFHNPDVKKYEYDIEKAKSILQKAGYIDYDGDGTREKPRGVPVKFILTTNSGNNLRENSCQIIKKDLQRIGLDVSYTPLEFNNLVTKVDTAGEWHAMIMGLTGGIEPHFGANVWKTDGNVHMYNQRPVSPDDERDWDRWQAGLRDWEYEIEEIYERGVEELDQAKRKAIYDEWQEIVAEELPYIYLVTSKTIPAVKNKFKNLKPTAYGGVFHNIDTELEIIP
jgi:peptide/nickel transport system substrate-binding protein